MCADDLKHAVQRVMHGQLWPIGLAVAGIYTISGAFQLIQHEVVSRGTHAAVAFTAAVCALAVAVAARRNWLPQRWSHHASLGIAAAAWCEVTWCILVRPLPPESLFVSLLVLGCGLLLLSPLYWAIVTAATAAVWIWAATVLAPEQNWSEYQYVVAAAAIISGVCLALRLRMIERLEAERINRARHAEQLALSEQRQSVILEALPMAMYTLQIIDGQMRTTWVSAQIDRITGFKPQHFIDDPQLWNRRLHPDDAALSDRQSRAIASDGQGAEEFRWQCADGTYRWFLDHAVATYDDEGRKTGLIGVWMDIDERKRVAWEKSRLEAELRQAQKLEAVGTLASGIAHDFNNLLTAINGFVRVARESLDRTHPTQEHLTRIEEAADRARQVTRSLLTFAHNAPAPKRPIDLVDVMEQSRPLVRRLLARDVQLHWSAPDDELWVRADATQLQRVLINLAINAGDVMPGGGVLDIRLQRDSKDAVLTVADDGPGMTEQVRERIFEPFFTTHSRGEATGLGLPVVHGILTDHNATINVDSTPGHGTTFIIRIPTCREPAPMPPEDQDDPPLEPMHNEMLLLAAPDAYIRQIMAETLESHGYVVHTVDDGPAAARWLTEHATPIDLLIADTGVDTSWLDAARLRRAEVPVLLISDAPDAMPAGEHVLAKPFQMAQMVEMVGQSLAEWQLTERGT